MAAVTACSTLPVAASLASQKLTTSSRASVSMPQGFVSNRSRVVMSAEKKEQNLALPVTAALIAAAIVPEIAEAAAPGVSPSLKNLLLSVLAGGVVLGGIGVAVAGVSVFDPVNRK